MESRRDNAHLGNDKGTCGCDPEGTAAEQMNETAASPDLLLGLLLRHLSFRYLFKDEHEEEIKKNKAGYTATQVACE